MLVVVLGLVPGIAFALYSILLFLTWRHGLESRVNRWFALYLFNMIVWSFGALMMYVDRQHAALWNKVMLVAADTFRAAAVEQLTIWAERVGVEVIKQATGADPSAVVFDAITAAVSRKVDIVLIDTAGRLHTKVNLMDELEKINRVTDKKLPGAPHEVWLILDATTGQNAISQAEIFNKALGVTDIVLTKLDGTAKGGIVVGISRQLRIPIRYIGIGETIDDLRPFDATNFVQAIFD